MNNVRVAGFSVDDPSVLFSVLLLQVVWIALHIIFPFLPVYFWDRFVEEGFHNPIPWSFAKYIGILRYSGDTLQTSTVYL